MSSDLGALSVRFVHPTTCGCPSPKGLCFLCSQSSEGSGRYTRGSLQVAQMTLAVGPYRLPAPCQYLSDKTHGVYHVHDASLFRVDGALTPQFSVMYRQVHGLSLREGVKKYWYLVGNDSLIVNIPGILSTSACVFLGWESPILRHSDEGSPLAHDTVHQTVPSGSK